MDRISNAQMNSLGTRKIYYEDVHQTDFTAVVTECVPAKEEGYYLIVLDASAFFPEEGGQSADKGTLNGQEVLDPCEFGRCVPWRVHLRRRSLPAWR